MSMKDAASHCNRGQLPCGVGSACSLSSYASMIFLAGAHAITRHKRHPQYREVKRVERKHRIATTRKDMRVKVKAMSWISWKHAVQSLRVLCACGCTSTRIAANLPSLPVSGSNPPYTVSCSSLVTLANSSALPVLFNDVFLTNSKLSRLSSGRRSWCVTRTSLVTKIWVQEAMTVGQNMGMDAHIIAKSISRQEMMRTSGYHHVKSKLWVML